MLTLIKSSFIEHKLTILRNKKTSNTLFRQTMNELSYLIAAEVLKYLNYKSVSVLTPICKTKGKGGFRISHWNTIQTAIKPPLYLQRYTMLLQLTAIA